MTTNAVDKCLFSITETEEIEVERQLRRPTPFAPAWPQAPKPRILPVPTSVPDEGRLWYRYQATLATKVGS
jgi:hypothetical protein